MSATGPCTFCGEERWEERRVEYLYSHQGRYLLVPNTPAQVCARCGTLYYEAAVLHRIEQQFFAIERRQVTPDRVVEVPQKAYA